MKTIASNGLSLSIVAFGVLHFVTYFLNYSFLLWMLSFAGAGIILLSIVLRSVKNLKIPMSLLLVGIGALIYSKEPLIGGIQNGLLEMRNILGLLIIVPFISWVLQEEPYMESIISYGNKFLNTSRKFYFGIITFTQVISYFLLFGSLQMVYHFVDDILKDKKGLAWESFKSTALLRGFALSTMWVISIPSFAFVVEIIGAPLPTAIMQGFGVAVVGVLIALVFSHFEEKKKGVDLTAELEDVFTEKMDSTKYDKRMMKRDFIEFIILFFSLFGTIFILQAFLNIELLVLIPFVVIPWVLIYYFYKKRLSKFFNQVKKHVKHSIILDSYQFCVLLCAGIMIYSLNQTNFASVVVEGIYSVQANFPFLNLLYFLPFIVIILGFFGLGPLTVMALVGGLLSNLDLPYPPEVIVLVITLGSAISTLLSPLILPLIALSNANRLSVIKNGLIFNWKYAVVLYIIVQFYVQLRIA